MTERNALARYRETHPENVVWSPERGWHDNVYHLLTCEDPACRGCGDPDPSWLVVDRNGTQVLAPFFRQENAQDEADYLNREGISEFRPYRVRHVEQEDA